VFVYTREAHPGEDVPHHESFERKLANARLLRDEVGIRRTILVDDLAGRAHRRYGTMPNMTWVIDRGGRVAYKANWTSAANVEAFLTRFLAATADRPRGTALARYETEQLEFRQVDRERFTKRLMRNGPRAAEEFSRAQRMWAQRGRG
jgi:hypothetical protein